MTGMVALQRAECLVLVAADHMRAASSSIHPACAQGELSGRGECAGAGRWIGSNAARFVMGPH